MKKAAAAPQCLLARPLIDALCAGVIAPDHRRVQAELQPVAVGQIAHKGSLLCIVPACRQADAKHMMRKLPAKPSQIAVPRYNVSGLQVICSR